MFSQDVPVPHRRSVPLYIGAGGLATASHYVAMIAMVEALEVHPFVASIAGFAVGASVKYLLNYFVAFRSTAQHFPALVRFSVALALLFVLNAVFFWILNTRLDLHYVVAQVLTTGLLIPPGYLISRLWVFRRP